MTVLCSREQQEIDVYSILAVDYQSKKSLKNIGMPAFNSKNELVGADEFYFHYKILRSLIFFCVGGVL